MANAQANVDTPSLQPDDGISLINEMCQNCLRGTCTYTRCRCRHGNEDVHFVDYPSLESSPAACFTSVTSPRPVASEGHHRAYSLKFNQLDMPNTNACQPVEVLSDWLPGGYS